MAEHVYSIRLTGQSVSSTSEIPFFVAPYPGFLVRATYAQQLSVVPNPGTAAEGALTIRLKNVTKATSPFLTDALSASGLSLLVALNFTLAATVENREFNAGDVFTVNWTATSASAGTGPGVAVIALHVRDGLYGGQIDQSFGISA